MFTAEQLASMRSTVGDTLSDTCTISEPSTETFNAGTGGYTTTPGAVVHAALACRFGSLMTADRVVEAGGEPVSLRTYRLRVSWDTTGIEPEQVVVATTSNDPHLQGSTFRVVDVQGMTDPVGRSVIVEETLG